MSLFGLVLYGLSKITDFPPFSQENRMVCVPGSFVKKLHEKAINGLVATGTEDHFLSEGDVLCAWWTRPTIS